MKIVPVPTMNINETKSCHRRSGTNVAVVTVRKACFHGRSFVIPRFEIAHFKAVQFISKVI
jgi:hypothetical protein